MTTAPSQTLVAELKVSGHLMTLEPGLYCVFHAPGSVPADAQTGLPGVRISHPPVQEAGLREPGPRERGQLAIRTFSEDGWIGASGGAALVRVQGAPAQLLVTIYQSAVVQHEAPKLQVMRLGDVAAPAAPAPEAVAGDGGPPGGGAFGASDIQPAMPSVHGFAEAAAASPTAGVPAAEEVWEVAAHIQRRGDRLGRLGEWMGQRGSQNWIEGFALAPTRQIGLSDIEYQAVLGKGWLSPWSDGGQYCGSRGMALPILGLRVRLKGEAAQTHTLRISATFTDGSAIGPAPDTQTLEAESLAPLEAFLVEIVANAAATAKPIPPVPAAAVAVAKVVRAVPAAVDKPAPRGKRR